MCLQTRPPGEEVAFGNDGVGSGGEAAVRRMRWNMRRRRHAATFEQLATTCPSSGPGRSGSIGGVESHLSCYILPQASYSSDTDLPCAVCRMLLLLVLQLLLLLLMHHP